MLFAFLAVLTFGSVAAAIWPLVRPRRGDAAARGAFDRAIYKDQLAELARERERGLIDEASTAAARIEIERRLLATEAAGETAPSPVAPGRMAAVAVALVISLGAVSLYVKLGSPELPDQPFAARGVEKSIAERSHAQGDLAAGIEALAAKLKANPQDASSWLLLARSQAALQRWPQAAESYLRAAALTHSPEANAGAGEMLVMAADGIITPAAREAFAAAVKSDPGNIAARFYLALADAQAGKPREALAAWQKLVDETPRDAPYRAMVRRQMEETAQTAGIDLPPETAPPSGPNADDVAAAASMTPEERQKMIRGMVAGLAARLEKTPDDTAGWLRLARAYTVLGETDKAAQAASRAAALAPNDVEAQLGAARALITAAGATHDPTVAVPEPALTALRRVIAIAPDQPDALWYLGLAAAQHHDPEAATGYWRRLLAALPPSGEDRKMVQAAIDALVSGKKALP
jgi:cytochrome c-type biogenesis protein CcmH